MPMDDARLERLLTRPQGPRPAKPKRIADELRQMVTEDGPAPGEMLRTRPKPKAPKEPRIERGPTAAPGRSLTAW